MAQRKLVSESDNLGDPPKNKSLTRKLKREEQRHQQKEKLRRSKTGPRKVPILFKPILSGKQKLLQHRLNLFRGTEKGAGGASVKRDSTSDSSAKTKRARQHKRRRRNAGAKKREQREGASE